MTGYARKDTSNNIADGNIINAADLDAEFDGVQDAFNSSTGHKHDGTSGEGAPITVVGPVQDVVISATAITPKTTNTVDIGNSSLKFKDIFITGTATLPTVSVTTLATNPVVSAGTANGVPYLNGSKVLTSGSALTFDGTNLGIGTSSPSEELHITAAIPTIRLEDSDDGSRAEILYNTGSGGLVLRSDQGAGAASSSNIIMSVDGTERLRIDSSGNVGIGTSSPSYKLHAISSSDYQGYFRNSTSTTGVLVGGVSGGGVVTSDSSGTPLFFGIGGTTRATLDTSGNLGLGVTPSAWGGSYKGFEIGRTGNGIYGYPSALTGVVSNAYFNGTSFIYANTGYASEYRQQNSEHRWYTAPSGTAGTAISFTQAMTLDASGNLGIGTSSPASAVGAARVLHVEGTTAGVRTNGTTGSVSVETYSGTTLGYVGTTSNHGFVITTNNTERLRIDSSGNLGLGVTPSAGTSGKVFQITNAGHFMASGSTVYIDANAYFDSGWKYITTAAASNYYQSSGAHIWNTASSGTAGNAISFTQAMTLDASGNLLVGATSATYSSSGRGLIEVNGSSNSLLALKRNGSGSAYLLASSGEFQVNNTEATPMTFYVNGSERARIDSSGNVGIGTSSPNSSLAITQDLVVTLASTNNNAVIGYNLRNSEGTNNRRAAFYLDDTNGVVGIATNATTGVPDFQLKLGNTTTLYATSSGNVGIGTSSPASPLDVTGSLGITISASKTDATVKTGRLRFQHYTNAEEPMTGLLGAAGTSSNILYIGGGSAAENAATDIKFYTAANNTTLTGTERMIIDSSGNVGIGTSSPSSKLEVADFIIGGSDASGTTGSIVIRSRETSDSTRTSIGALRSSGASYFGRAVEPSTTVANGFNGGFTATTGGGAWVIGNSGETYFTSFPSAAMTKGSALSMQERARIDSSGNLLVGTTSALNSYIGGTVITPRLQVEVNSASGALSVTRNGGDPFIMLNNSATVTSGTGIGTIYFSGGDGTRLVNGASISAEIDATPGTLDMPAAIVFSTTANGTGSVAERARITSSGYLRLASGTGGIQFNGNATTSTALNDYEEGTWTPVIADAASGGNTGSATIAGANYTKIGRQVTVTCALSNIVTTGLTAGNSLYIRGLPFASVSTSSSWGGVNSDTVAFGTGKTQLTSHIGTSSSSMLIFASGTGTTDAVLTVAAITSGSSDLWTTITYFV